MFHMKFKLRLLLAFAITTATSISCGQTCSLVVKVVDSRNEIPPAPTTVEAIEGGNITTTARTEAGIARFCGLGLGPVVVVVGADSHYCQTVIRDVPLKWNKEVTIQAMHDLSACKLGQPPIMGYEVSQSGRFACQKLVRFVDQWGVPVARPTVKSTTTASGPDKDRVADDFGRLLITVYSDDEFRGTALLRGFDPAPLNLRCLSVGDFSEERVVLNKGPAARP